MRLPNRLQNRNTARKRRYRDTSGRMHDSVQRSGDTGGRRARNKGRKIAWRRVALLAFGVVLIFSLIRLIGYISNSARRRQVNAQLQALHVTDAPSAVPQTPPPTEAPTAALAQAAAATPAPTPYGKVMPNLRPTVSPTLKPTYQAIGNSNSFLDDMRALYWKNKDVVGWLKIPGVVDLPVVYRDNVYYIDHDFYGQKNQGGTLFLDVLHPLMASTQHLVIHGHNMKDGTMFAHLSHYQSPAYTRDHDTIQWSSLYRRETYRIFAVSIVSIDPAAPTYVSYLGTNNFRTEAQFRQLLDQLRKNAVYWKGEDVDASDALMTLSTCLNEDRILVVAKRVSP